MARVRHIQIRNFRGIAALDWAPSPGVNCLIGPGDSGKTTVLDAVDLCLGARRSVPFSDADFHNLDIEQPISIAVTLGDLPETLRSMEGFGLYLRNFDAATGAIDDEPERSGETVLTLQLTVSSDLEPVWALTSQRAVAQSQSRGLAWSDRLQLAPVRIGGSGELNLGWRRGSVLNRLSDEKADASAALIKAVREARAGFGDQAATQLATTLDIVKAVANDLGIKLEGDAARALLDAQSVSFAGGTVSLHDGRGVPLREMGVGSTRLLIAGLQRKAASQAGITLVDELEHGLEPHRIIRLIASLGAKEKNPPLQVFATTHSPVAVRELAASQLHVVRKQGDHHEVIPVGAAADDVQGTIRRFPEAFLASSVIVCEGASEVGLLRGLDLYLVRQGKSDYQSLAAKGVALVDAGGVSQLYDRVNAFVALGFRALALRDDDKQPPADVEQAFLHGGGTVVMWRSGRALEDELFQSLPDDAVLALIDRGIELHGEKLIDDHLRSASGGKLSLSDRGALLLPANRPVVGKAARSNKGWFKTVSWMEDVAADIIGPHLIAADEGFQERVLDVFRWMA
ncbi:MAG: ATP-dependent endonuclease [Rhodospirillales bacterium 69-11]|nr:AAA family ATPase [Rhodospirillales bacterium]OJW33056.1 MAG: ATP-dependent endonuclease [Rhodospirillales bacterium 69-11]